MKTLTEKIFHLLKVRIESHVIDGKLLMVGKEEIQSIIDQHQAEMAEGLEESARNFIEPTPLGSIQDLTKNAKIIADFASQFIREKQQEKALQALADQAQELNMGYGSSTKNKDGWISVEDRLPEIKDLPFVTEDLDGLFEVWDVGDILAEFGLDELTEFERLDYVRWMPLVPKIK